MKRLLLAAIVAMAASGPAWAQSSTTTGTGVGVARSTSSSQAISGQGGTGIVGYSGNTTITSGTLQVSADNNLGGGQLAISVGTFRAAASIASTRAIALQNAASAIQVDGGFTYAASSGATRTRRSWPPSGC